MKVVSYPIREYQKVLRMSWILTSGLTANSTGVVVEKLASAWALEIEIQGAIHQQMERVELYV